MASKIAMINSGLILVGDKPLNSLTEDRRAAVVANALYDSLFEAEITRHRWGFARKIQALNLLVDKPLDKQYTNAFQIPADMLVAVRIIPNEYDYRRYGDKIYSNQPQIQLDYITKVDESKLPAYFVRMMEYALARDFSVSIRDEMNRFEGMDIRYKEEGRNARFQDSQEFPQEPITDAPFIMPRF